MPDLAQKLPSTNYDKMCVDAHEVKRIASEKQHKAPSELETACERQRACTVALSCSGCFCEVDLCIINNFYPENNLI